LALLAGFVPIALVLAFMGMRSIQGPVRGRAVPRDGVERNDLVARLRCQGYGIHGAHRTDEKFRVFESRKGFRFLFAYRGLAPAGCSLEVLHPLYRMAYVPLERRFHLDLGTLHLEAWEDLLEAPEGLSTADLNRHVFYLRHYYLKGFRRERARADLARYLPALHALFDRGLQVLPPMDRDRFGSTEDSLAQLRAIEGAVGYVRPREQEALFEAAEVGDAEEVRVLLGEGVDPDAWNARHRAAIHLAASAKHPEVVQALLEGGADVDRREEGLGDTALIVALLHSDEETARLLIESGADVTVASRGRTPLQLAAGRGMASIVRLLIERGAVAHASQERHVVAALHGAARAGRTEVVELLLAAGVPTDAGLPGFTAFMQAAWQGKLETAQLLLAAGADPNAVSVTGKTALAYARAENRVEVVAWLERLGARE
jgi:ankyrin repeat protein